MHIGRKPEVAVKYFLKICFGSSLKWPSINFAHRFYYDQETSIFRFTRELLSFAYNHFISYYGQSLGDRSWYCYLNFMATTFNLFYAYLWSQV